MRSHSGTSSVDNVSAKNENMPVHRSATLFAADATLATVLGALMVYSAFRPRSSTRGAGPSGYAWRSRWSRRSRWPRAACCRSLAQRGGVTSIAAWMLGFERDSFLTVSLVLYVIAASRPPRRSGLLLATSIVTTSVVYLIAAPVSTLRPQPTWWQVLGVAATPIAIESVGWALGLAVYRQRSYVEAVRTQAAQEVRAQTELAARSAAEERLRIARELHDAVAHAMSVITVQAGVARYIDTGMPERASAALETIESTGRQALRDMRQLLGVLRAEGNAPRAARLPRCRISTSSSRACAPPERGWICASGATCAYCRRGWNCPRTASSKRR